MYIDPRIMNNTTTIPTFGKLDNGQTFIYDEDLFIKIDNYTTVKLSDAELYNDGDIPFEAGVTPVKVKIVPADD